MNKYLIGIDIGGTKCAVILGNEAMDIIDKDVFPTETELGAMKTIDRILSSVEAILSKNNIERLSIEKIGICCGGPLDSEKGLILSPPNLPGWDEIPIVAIFEERFKKPTYLQNDADACALAEWKLGAGRGCKNMVFLTFGTGLGAGLILNGELYTGASNMAGEVGHIRLEKKGPIGYGKTGSFEGFCSGGGIAQIAKQEIIKKLSKGETVSFCDSFEKADKITAKDVGLAAQEGDEFAIEILEFSGRYLGIGLSILIDILNPDRIIIGGIFTRMEQFLKPAAQKIIEKEALELSKDVCRVLPAGLGERIGDYAALSVAINGK